MAFCCEFPAFLLWMAQKQARKPRMPSRWSPWSAGAPSYPGRWLFGLFAACWGSHQPLFLGGAGQFLEHIRAEVFPDERILVEQSKAANLSPLRRFGVQAYRPGRRLEQLEELALINT